MSVIKSQNIKHEISFSPKLLNWTVSVGKTVIKAWVVYVIISFVIFISLGVWIFKMFDQRRVEELKEFNKSGSQMFDQFKEMQNDIRQKSQVTLTP